jgi:hypothetical protein
MKQSSTLPQSHFEHNNTFFLSFVSSRVTPASFNPCGKVQDGRQVPSSNQTLQRRGEEEAAAAGEAERVRVEEKAIVVDLT